MVLSQLDKSIKYPEIKAPDAEDIGFDATLYEIELKPKISASHKTLIKLLAHPIKLNALPSGPVKSITSLRCLRCSIAIISFPRYKRRASPPLQKFFSSVLLTL